MKKLRNMLLSIAAISICQLSEAAEMPDTVASITDATNVTVVKSDNGVKITVANDKDNNTFSYSAEAPAESADADLDFDLPFIRDKHKMSKIVTGEDWCIGFAIPVDAPDGMRQSYNLELQNVLGARWWMSHNSALSIGVGLGAYRLNLGKNHCFTKEDDRLMIVSPNTESGVSEMSSQMTSFYFMLPLKFRQRIGGNFGFTLSAILRYNTYTTASTKYHYNGAKYKESYKHLEQQPYSLDLQAGIGFLDTIGIYVKYSPTRPFQKGYGPDFKTLCVGVVLGM